MHISDLSWTKKYNHPADALQRGQELKCVVLEVDEVKRRVSLGVKQLTEDPWIRAIPEKYIPGQIVKGHVTKITNFGVFVELEQDLEGLLHISELADHKINSPQDIVSLGEELEVKILRVDNDSRKIGLSLRRVRWAAEEQQKQAHQTEAMIEESKPQRRGGLDGALMPEPAVVTSSTVIEPSDSQKPVVEVSQEKSEAESQQDAEKVVQKAKSKKREPALSGQEKSDNPSEEGRDAAQKPEESDSNEETKT